jgi:hypothetical protein
MDAEMITPFCFILLHFCTTNLCKNSGVSTMTSIFHIPFLFCFCFFSCLPSTSQQVILTLFAFKLVYPKGLHLTRGNHETKNMNKVYGFEGEVLHKLDGASMRLFEQCFCCLPLSALIEDQVFCVHGGLASEVTLSKLRLLRIRPSPALTRFCCEDNIAYSIVFPIY